MVAEKQSGQGMVLCRGGKDRDEWCSVKMVRTEGTSAKAENATS